MDVTEKGDNENAERDDDVLSLSTDISFSDIDEEISDISPNIARLNTDPAGVRHDLCSRKIPEILPDVAALNKDPDDISPNVTEKCNLPISAFEDQHFKLKGANPAIGTATVGCKGFNVLNRELGICYSYMKYEKCIAAACYYKHNLVPFDHIDGSRISEILTELKMRLHNKIHPSTFNKIVDICVKHSMPDEINAFAVELINRYYDERMKNHYRILWNILVTNGYKKLYKNFDLPTLLKAMLGKCDDIKIAQLALIVLPDIFPECIDSNIWLTIQPLYEKEIVLSIPYKIFLELLKKCQHSDENINDRLCYLCSVLYYDQELLQTCNQMDMLSLFRLIYFNGACQCIRDFKLKYSKKYVDCSNKYANEKDDKVVVCRKTRKNYSNTNNDVHCDIVEMEIGTPINDTEDVEGFQRDVNGKNIEIVTSTPVYSLDRVNKNLADENVQGILASRNKKLKKSDVYKESLQKSTPLTGIVSVSDDIEDFQNDVNGNKIEVIVSTSAYSDSVDKNLADKNFQGISASRNKRLKKSDVYKESLQKNTPLTGMVSVSDDIEDFQNDVNGNKIEVIISTSAYSNSVDKNLAGKNFQGISACQHKILKKSDINSKDIHQSSKTIFNQPTSPVATSFRHNGLESIDSKVAEFDSGFKESSARFEHCSLLRNVKFSNNQLEITTINDGNRFLSNNNNNNSSENLSHRIDISNDVEVSYSKPSRSEIFLEKSLLQSSSALQHRHNDPILKSQEEKFQIEKGKQNRHNFGAANYQLNQKVIKNECFDKFRPIGQDFNFDCSNMIQHFKKGNIDFVNQVFGCWGLIRNGKMHLLNSLFSFLISEHSEIIMRFMWLMNIHPSFKRDVLGFIGISLMSHFIRKNEPSAAQIIFNSLKTNLPSIKCTYILVPYNDIKLNDIIQLIRFLFTQEGENYAMELLLNYNLFDVTNICNVQLEDLFSDIFNYLLQHKRFVHLRTLFNNSKYFTERFLQADVERSKVVIDALLQFIQ